MQILRGKNVRKKIKKRKEKKQKEKSRSRLAGDCQAGM